MQINLKDNKARIRLTKQEQKTLVSARQILEGLEKFEPSLEGTSDIVGMVTDQLDENGVFVLADETGPGSEVLAEFEVRDPLGLEPCPAVNDEPEAIADF